MRRARRSHESHEGVELRQQGFPVSFALGGDGPESGVARVLDDLLHDFLTPNSLECGGGFHRGRFQGFVTRWKGSATEADRRGLADWLRARAEVGAFEVGEMAQAWYGSDETAQRW